MSVSAPRHSEHRFRIGADHPCLPGHFPGHPLVPGVVMLDQLAAAVRAQHGMRVTRIVEAKFVAPLLPEVDAEVALSGETPRLRFEIRSQDGVLVRGRVEVQA